MTTAGERVTAEIIGGKLLAIADEMGIVLARSSMSPVIYEVLDFACGICDPNGELIAQSNGITLFTGMFSGQVRFIRRKFGAAIYAGDIFITNDPYEGGTHTADVCIVKPVFADGALVAFAVAVAHWSEIGGKVVGSLSPDSVEIYEEGVRLSGLKLYDRSVCNQAVMDILEANIRMPRLSLGDLNAELAAVRIADERLVEMCARYGRTTLAATFRHIVEASEAISRKAVAAMPDGVYRAEDVIDGDGVHDERIPVCVAVTIAGERMRFDFTGCAAQRAAPINCSRWSLVSAVRTVFKAFAGPHQPSNEGWFRPIEVVVPDGTVFSAVKPAAVGWYFESSCHASELAWKALAPLAPERFSAGSYVSLCGTYIAGRRAGTGEPFVHLEPQHGGWGAGRQRDGASALIALTDGDTYNYSSELIEAKVPLRVHSYGLNVADGSGAGRQRGGYGIVRDYEMLADEGIIYASYGRSIEKPWGVAGGRQGTTNYIELTQRGVHRRVTRTPSTPLHRGDRIRIATGGGGGWGSPLERAPEEVVRDVWNGYVTPAQARDDYAVVVGRNLELDANATAALRAAHGR